MPLTSPRTSVLMAAYNAAPYVDAAVNSILRQTYTDFELIIVDDGSTDATWEVLEHLAAQDARIRIERNPENRGFAATRNRALALARGEFVAVMDADDISLPDRFAKQVAYLSAHPEIGVLGAHLRYWTGEDGQLSEVVPVPLQPYRIPWALCFGAAVMDGTSIMRRSLLVEVGGWNSEFVVTPDYDLWQRLSRITRLANLPDVVLHYRKHGGNITTRRIETAAREAHAVAQRAVEAVYGQPVPLELVRQTVRYHGCLVQDIGAVSRLVYTLAVRFRAAEHLTPSQWQSIRRGAAQHIVWLLRSRTEGGSTTQALAYAARLDPLYVGRWMQAGLWKTARRRLNLVQPE